MMSLGEIASGLAIIDWLQKRFTKTSQTEQSVADRFLLLFEKHDVHRSQIPRFFGYGLTIEDTSSSEKLLPKLNHTILEAASELFKVRLEWLEGADEQIYPVHHIYKQPNLLYKFLAKLNTDNRQFFSLHISHVSEDDDALFIITEAIGEIGNKTIDRHHLFGDWSYRYGKCRADLAACVAIAEKQKLFIQRVNETSVSISKYANGYGFVTDLEKLPRQVKRSHWLRKHYEPWYPDIWLSNPEEFVENLGNGEWGKTVALNLWLKYYDLGYLETGHNSVSKYLFEQYLTELSKSNKTL